MRSEYGQFIDTLRNLGIPHQHHHHFDKQPWQERINRTDYAITCHAVTGIQVGQIMYLFSSGQPHWYVEPTPDGDVAENAQGPSGGFMFAYDMGKDEILPRTHYRFGDGTVLSDNKNLAAMGKVYGFTPKRSKPISAKLKLGEQEYPVSYDSDKDLFFGFPVELMPRLGVEEWLLIVPPYDAELTNEQVAPAI